MSTMIPATWKLVTPCPAFCNMAHADPASFGTHSEVSHFGGSYVPEETGVKLDLARLDEWDQDDTAETEMVVIGDSVAVMSIEGGDGYTLTLNPQQLRDLAAGFLRASRALDLEVNP